MKTANYKKALIELRGGKAVLREECAGRVVELLLRVVPVDLRGGENEPELEIEAGALSEELIEELIERVIVPGMLRRNADGRR